MPQRLRDALLAYLRSRPYAEVAEGIALIEAMKEIKEKKEEKAEDA